MTSIRILLVDDHAVVRSGLTKFLMVNKDLELAAEASDGLEAVQLAGLHHPDVILMDLMMPGMDGITATRAPASASRSATRPSPRIRRSG